MELTMMALCAVRVHPPSSIFVGSELYLHIKVRKLVYKIFSWAYFTDQVRSLRVCGHKWLCLAFIR
jgi:hypothetical protein